MKKDPLPVNGVLDLRGWDFKKDGRVSTKGYWEFYFEEFLSSRQFDSLEEKCYTWVPGVWKSKYVQAGPEDTLQQNISQLLPSMPWQKSAWKGKKMGGTGYASYRLMILFPPGQTGLAFRIQDVGTAMKLFVDDSLVASSGKLGTTKDTSSPQYLPQTVFLSRLKDTTSLTLWISNFHYRKGGPWKEINIGDTEYLRNYYSLLTDEQFFMLGIYFMVTFVMLCFFLYRPKEKAILFIFLGALSNLIRSLMADNRLITTFYPGIDFELMTRLEIITGFSGFMLFILALHELYPVEFPEKIRKINAVALVILVIGTFSTHSIIYSNLVVPFQFLHLFNLVYGSIALIVAATRRREGALVLAVPYIIVSISSTLMILFYNQMVNVRVESYYLQLAVIIAFAQVVLLARIFSSALNRVENFAGELELTVTERTKELVAAQEQILTVARNTENEKIRRRISQDIHDDISSGLNKISWMGELVRVKAMKNKTEEMNALLDKIIRASRETVDHLIEIIWSLNPNNDDLESLISYLRNYIHRFFEDTVFKVNIQFPELPERIELNPELKRNLFLVTKEALHNAAKYSEAETITVTWNNNGKSCRLMIMDDGVGMEEGVILGTGNGMINMRKRMESVGWTFEVETSPGKGTGIILKGEIY